MSFETSRTDYTVTQPSTPQERSPQEGTYRRLGIACCFHLQGTGLKIETAAVSVIFVPLHHCDLHICHCDNLMSHQVCFIFFVLRNLLAARIAKSRVTTLRALRHWNRSSIPVSGKTSSKAHPTVCTTHFTYCRG